MFPDRNREGNSCDSGTLWPATQRYGWELFAATLQRGQHEQNVSPLLAPDRVRGSLAE